MTTECWVILGSAGVVVWMLGACTRDIVKAVDRLRERSSDR